MTERSQAIVTNGGCDGDNSDWLPMNRAADELWGPNMNGYQATRIMRKKGIKTAIIAVTANAMKGDDKKCIDAGCDEYLTKPIDRRELLRTISKYLPSKEPALIDTPESQ